MRLRLVIAYVGTGYMGWQVQAQHLAMQTIQGQLEHALQLLAGQEVRVHGSGRTDSISWTYATCARRLQRRGCILTS